MNKLRVKYQYKKFKNIIKRILKITIPIAFTLLFLLQLNLTII